MRARTATHGSPAGSSISRFWTVFLWPLALLALLSACENSPTLANESEVTETDPLARLLNADLWVLAGSAQEDTVAAALAQPLVVRVTDTAGDPIRGVTIRWTFEQGGGYPVGDSTTPRSVFEMTTDSAGRAAARWELGTVAGEQSVAADIVLPASGSASQTVGGPAGAPLGWRRFVNLWARAWAGEVQNIDVSPDHSVVEAGETLTMSAQGTDRWGNTIQSLSMQWESSDESVAVVSSTGQVTTTGTGSASITASSGSVEGSAMVEAVSGTAVALGLVSGGDQSGPVGSALPQPITVSVADVDGNPVSGVTVAWSVVSGGGQVSRASSVSDSLGRASTNWTLGGLVGRQRLSAMVSGLPSLVIDATATVGALASISINPGSVGTEIGQTVQLNAYGADAFGNPLPLPSLAWQSANTSVATVSSTGLVTAVGTGSTTVLASQGGVSASVPVTVVTATADPAALNMVSGNSQSGTVGSVLGNPLTVRVTDDGGTPLAGVAVSWTVVSGGGQLETAQAVTDGAGNASAAWRLGTTPGAQTLRASVSGLTPLTFNATATVGALASIDLTPASISIAVGATSQLTATGRDAFGNPVPLASPAWQSANAAVATVSSSGLVTAVSSGSTTARVTVGGVTGTASVAVTAQPPAGVTDLALDSVGSDRVRIRWTQVSDGNGNPATYALRYGEAPFNWGSASATQQFAVGTSVGSPIEFEWTNLDPDTDYSFQVVSYRQDTQGNVFGPLSNVVNARTEAPTMPSGATVRVTPGSVAFHTLGRTADLTAEVIDAFGNVLPGYSFEYTSLDPSIVEVSNMGRLTAVGVGTALVVASTMCCDGSDTITVSVDQIPAFINGLPATLNAEVGDSLTLNPQVVDSAGNPVPGMVINVTSSNTTVVSVTAVDDDLITIRAENPGSSVLRTSIEGASQVEATTNVNVADTTSPPPPGPGEYNEPTGFTTLIDQTWDSYSQDDWWDDDATIFSPVYGSSGIVNGRYRWTFEAGMPGGYLAGTRLLSENTPRHGPAQYTRINMRYSSNWYGNAYSDKIFFWTHPFTNAPRSYIRSLSNGNSAIYPGVDMQGWPDNGVLEYQPYGRTNLANPSGAAPGAAQALPRNQDFMLEVLLYLGTPGNADGMLKIWVDGDLILHFENLRVLGSGDTAQFGQIHLAPVWGGGFGPLPADQWVEFIDTYVSYGPNPGG